MTAAVARALSDAFEFTYDEAYDLARVAAPAAVQYLADSLLALAEAGDAPCQGMTR